MQQFNDLLNSIRKNNVPSKEEKPKVSAEEAKEQALENVKSGLLGSIKRFAWTLVVLFGEALLIMLAENAWFPDYKWSYMQTLGVIVLTRLIIGSKK